MAYFKSLKWFECLAVHTYSAYIGIEFENRFQWRQSSQAYICEMQAKVFTEGSILINLRQGENPIQYNMLCERQSLVSYVPRFPHRKPMTRDWSSFVHFSIMTFSWLTDKLYGNCISALRYYQNNTCITYYYWNTCNCCLKWESSHHISYSWKLWIHNLNSNYTQNSFLYVFNIKTNEKTAFEIKIEEKEKNVLCERLV